jgi:hypothetical protein
VLPARRRSLSASAARRQGHAGIEAATQDLEDPPQIHLQDGQGFPSLEPPASLLTRPAMRMATSSTPAAATRAADQPDMAQQPGDKPHASSVAAAAAAAASPSNVSEPPPAPKAPAAQAKAEAAAEVAAAAAVSAAMTADAERAQSRLFASTSSSSPHPFVSVYRDGGKEPRLTGRWLGKPRGHSYAEAVEAGWQPPPLAPSPAAVNRAAPASSPRKADGRTAPAPAPSMRGPGAARAAGDQRGLVGSASMQAAGESRART